MKIIDDAFDGKTDFESPEVRQAVNEIISGLDEGRLRVAEKINEAWVVHTHIKKAILLFFRHQKMESITAGDLQFFDKVPLKKWNGSEGVRVVPSALVRKGAFISKNVILMPSYVNIGAYVGEGSMVDTWATVGSCAQIGAQVHLSGGVGIGGVLEPVQGNPVIIEDHVFVGSRCIVVEGVVVEEGAVLGAGVILTASTKVYDVTDKEVKLYQKRIPKNAVVIPGTTQKEFPAGTFGVPCALIIGSRTAQTDKKTSLTQALRDYNVSV